MRRYATPCWTMIGFTAMYPSRVLYWGPTVTDILAVILFSTV